MIHAILVVSVIYALLCLAELATRTPRQWRTKSGRVYRYVN